MKKRTFIAIPFSTGLKNNIREFEVKFKKESGYQGKIIPPEKIHLTLKFLGDTEEELFSNIKQGLQKASKGIGSFKIKIVGLGVFPNLRRPRVIWLGLDNIPNNLVQLHENIDHEISPLGFPAENRAFKPHLTISRVKKRIKDDRFFQFFKQNMTTVIGEDTITEVHHIESKLTPKGAIYTVINSVKIKM